VKYCTFEEVLLPQRLPIEMDKTSPIPIYFQLKQGIERMIDAGELRAGQALPSENELSRLFRISPMTVRRAMAELVNAGYVHRERGRGTFVSPRRMQHQLEHLISFTEDMKARRMQPSSQILLLEQAPPPAALVQRLNWSPDGMMTRIKRVRLADQVPVGIHDSYLNGVQVTRTELENAESLYALLEEKGILLVEGEESIEAIAADTEASALLGVAPGAPLLQAIRCSWDAAGQLIEYVVAQYHADLYRYTIRLKR
jgi:GntR family transcriptional regulator